MDPVRPITPDSQLYLKQILDLQIAGVEGLLRRGEILEEAAVHLRPVRGAWTRFTRALPFTARTANRYRSIARHPVLRDRTFTSRLPDELVVLYFISRLAPELVLVAIEDGRINPRMTLRDARALLEPSSRARSSQSQQSKAPWTMAGAFRKIHRALAGAPAEAHREIGRQLHEVADTYGPKRTRSDAHAGRSAGRAGKPDVKVLRDLISSGLRSLAARHHPDRGGDTETMKQINLAVAWLRDKAGI